VSYTQRPHTSLERANSRGPVRCRTAWLDIVQLGSKTTVYLMVCDLRNVRGLAATTSPADANLVPPSEGPTLIACSDWRPFGPAYIESGTELNLNAFWFFRRGKARVTRLPRNPCPLGSRDGVNLLGLVDQGGSGHRNLDDLSAFGEASSLK